MFIKMFKKCKEFLSRQFQKQKKLKTIFISVVPHWLKLYWYNFLVIFVHNLTIPKMYNKEIYIYTKKK